MCCQLQMAYTTVMKVDTGADTGIDSGVDTGVDTEVLIRRWDTDVEAVQLLV